MIERGNGYGKPAQFSTLAESIYKRNKRKMTKRLKALMARLKADLIREDGRLERHCEHGIGHTVGHVDTTSIPEGSRKYITIHGCDGCCSKYLIQKELLAMEDAEQG